MEKIDIAKMNEYFYKINMYPNIFYDHLDLFYRVALFMKNKCVSTELYKTCIDKLEYISLLDNIELVKEFYKEHNIDEDIDELISNGTINFIEQEGRIKSITKGVCHYEKDISLVDVWKEGNLLDGIVLVHELSHYRDGSGNNQIKNMFTEGLAYAEERIYVDWLEEKGYKGIKEAWDKLFNFLNYEFYKSVYANLKIYYLFKEIGDISKESYEYFYQDNSNYDEVIKYFENDNNLNNLCWYSFGIATSYYIYDRYINNKITMEDINRYHNSISESLSKAVEDIGLEDIYDDNIEGIIKAVEDNYIDYDEELVMKH